VIDPGKTQTLHPEINEVSIPRLFAYHRALAAVAATGKTLITSQGLAVLVGQEISSHQIRKDLSALGPLGRRGHGYAINPLVQQLALVLGLEHDWRIAIVGFGYLGHAFATFITAREERFKVGAIFDNSPSVVGSEWQGIRVHDSRELEQILPGTSCNIGVIAVPAAAAGEQAKRLAAHVGAILNFAPISLGLDVPVIVRNIDLAGEMSILTHRLSFAQGLA